MLEEKVNAKPSRLMTNMRRNEIFFMITPFGMSLLEFNRVGLRTLAILTLDDFTIFKIQRFFHI